MFSLIAGFWNYFFSKTEVNILILGLDYAGKTTILEQVKGMYGRKPGISPDKIPPTIGLNIGKFEISNCKVTIWDLGGQVRMRSIWDKYYKDTHGMIFVIDSVDISRFEEAKLAFDSLLNHPNLSEVPMMLVANKQDLPNAIHTEDVGVNFEVHVIKQRPIRVQSMSGLTKQGISEGMSWIVEESERNARKFGR
mmetsp:Transcript_40612/g.70967  ORF Transcript_40612/g.70967 Transcript_40612/m.70967 type:complete len:194 (-) Transcript_40612:254-835(-)|eukprot:CAMPEP_0194578432 /NCGR_PEP_ID=MMETSP0292-20121207/12847_1 /TAXON_ID=39354 /ORGANISM="Heterosigma akashiwo, Strain CCMP2393" /LENGTH=193 /DNA_ID=CAMNT_0039431075 /DNA_START=135 /DNA_END=716 /DNA_ORIENTATION=-